MRLTIRIPRDGVRCPTAALTRKTRCTECTRVWVREISDVVPGRADSTDDQERGDEDR